MGKSSTKSSTNEKNKTLTKKLSKKKKAKALINGDASEDDLNKLIAKQQEAGNVIEQKKTVLASNQLSYLEYIEMQEEICRLNDFRDSVQVKINGLRRLRKK